jgi:hypothetical protein
LVDVGLGWSPLSSRSFNIKFPLPATNTFSSEIRVPRQTNERVRFF